MNWGSPVTTHRHPLVLKDLLVQNAYLQPQIPLLLQAQAEPLHPAPSPETEYHKCTDPGSTSPHSPTRSSPWEGKLPQGTQAAQEPGCHWLAFRGSWVPRAPWPGVALTVAASWGY